MKKLITILVSAIVLATGVLVGSSYVLAEQSGSSPESGVTSYFKATYDSIVALSHGSVAAGAWGDWGAYWNRIRSAAEWVPSGDAAVTDVVSGKTFYKDSRTKATGTKLVVGPCPTQAYHDSHALATAQNNCSQTWESETSVTGSEKKDPVTGLIWSNLLVNNAGTVAFSPSTNSTWSWDASAAANVAVGNKTASQLCSERGDGWRLPMQKELMQAYIDGSTWNLTQSANFFWSATETYSTLAWYVTLNTGLTLSTDKTTVYQLRCVR